MRRLFALRPLLTLSLCLALAIPTAVPLAFADESPVGAEKRPVERIAPPPGPTLQGDLSSAATESIEATVSVEDDDYAPGDPLPASPVYGWVSYSTDTWDVYYVVVNAGSTLSLTLAGDSGTDFDLYVADEYGNTIDSSTSSGSYETLSYTPSFTDIYCVAVRAYTGQGSYTLSWSKSSSGGSLPDLRPTAVSIQTPIMSGTSVMANLTVKNFGSAPSGSFDIKYYLSPDAYISSADYLIGEKWGSSLSAGATSSRSDALYVAGAPAGWYYIGAIVDPSSYVTESDETNNWAYGNTVLLQQPTPTVGSLALNAPGYPAWGEYTAFQATYWQDRGDLAGKSVVLEFRAQGSSYYTDAAWGTTDASGIAAFNISPRRKGTYRVRTAFNGSWLYSGEAYVAPAPGLSISSKASVGRGKKFTVSGYLTPRHAKGKRTVLIKCYLNGKLRKTVRAKNYNYSTSWGTVITKYRATVTLPKPGRWTLKASVPGDSLHIAKTTGAHIVSVNKTRMSARNSGYWTTYRSGVTVSGYLRSRTGKGMGGKTVRLQTWTGGRWKTIKKLRTNSKGRAAYKVKPKKGAYYRFYYPGSSSQMKVTSAYTWVYSCYDEWSGYTDYTTGYWIRTTWLSKGKHRVRVYAAQGLNRAYIETSGGTWRKELGSKPIPSSSWRTYYVRVPADGYYRLGWTGNWGYSNYLRFNVW